MATSNQILDENGIPRRAFLVRGMIAAAGFLFYPFRSALSSAQEYGRSNAWEELHIEKILDWLRETFSIENIHHAHTANEMYEKLKKIICEKDPEMCNRLPYTEEGVCGYGSAIALAYRAPYARNASALFYEDENESVVLMPALAVGAIQKAANYLKNTKSGSSFQIRNLLFPISVCRAGNLDSQNDCYVYRSKYAFVRLKYTGISSQGEIVNVRVVQGSSRKFDPDLRLQVPKSFSECAGFSECDYIDKFDDIYLDESFYVPHP